MATGKMLQIGAKASTGKKYYLLQRNSYLSAPSGVSAQRIGEVRTPLSFSWYLYCIDILRFSTEVAHFFLQRSIFLTESPTEIYPIWPPYIEDPYFIYHSEDTLYFYMRGENTEVKTFPITYSYFAPQCSEVKNGWLYKIHASSKEQLLSLGVSGALGFSYLLKEPLNKQAPFPAVQLTDAAGNVLAGDSYTKLPKSKLIFVLSKFDGKAIIYKNRKLQLIYKISAEQSLLIDAISFGTEIQLFQGCDCVRTIQFVKETVLYDATAADQKLVSQLKACQGESIDVPHSLGAIVEKLSSYPHTKQWIYSMICQGKMPRAAYRLLVKQAHKAAGGNRNGR